MLMRALTWLIVAVVVAVPVSHSGAAARTEPGAVSFEIVTGGPLGPKRPLTVLTTGKWKVKAAPDGTWLSVIPTEGTGRGTVSLGLTSDVSWRPPGVVSSRVIIATEDGAETQVAVTLHIKRRSPDPRFSYVDGPKHCTRPEGYPDAALCTVPDEKPPGNFTPPPAGQSYVDANFGARVRVLAPPRSLHGYSAPSALSATNKHALILQDGLPRIVDIATGRQEEGHAIPVEGTFWDIKDDEILYFTSGATFRRYNIRTRARTVLVDYARPPYGLAAITTGASWDSSRDNWIAFYAPRQSTVCALDLNTVRTYCAKYESSYGGVPVRTDNSGAVMAKGVDRQTGKRYVILASRPVVVFSVNLAKGVLDLESVGPEVPDWGGNGDGVCEPKEVCLNGDHIDTFEDQNGIQYIMAGLETTEPCEYSLNSFQISKGTRMTWPAELGGGRKRIMPLYRCAPGAVWPDWHLGCARHGRYCVMSTTYGGFARQRNANDPIKRGPHMSEIFVIRDNGEEVRRLVQHRSVPLTGEEAQSYWTTPRACISADGAYVIADSNFGSPDGNRVVLIETGFGAK
jgi:hypothetical protein